MKLATRKNTAAEVTLATSVPQLEDMFAALVGTTGSARKEFLSSQYDALLARFAYDFKPKKGQAGGV